LKYIVAYFWTPLKGVLRTLAISVPPFFNSLSKKMDRIEIELFCSSAAYVHHEKLDGMQFSFSRL